MTEETREKEGRVPLTDIITPQLVSAAISQQGFVQLDTEGTIAPFWIRLELAGTPLLEPEASHSLMVEHLSDLIKAAVKKHQETMMPQQHLVDDIPL